ncbi:MAG: asparagine synthase-related protein [Balneolales bacterium]
MKIAACFAPKPVNAAEVAKKMAMAQQVADHQVKQIYSIEGGAIACISGGERASSIAMHRVRSGHSLLMHTGIPLSRAGQNLNLSDEILSCNAKEAERILTNLDGAYASVFWSMRERKLVVVTDMLGMQPLYIFRKNGMLLLATDMKGITGSGLVRIKMSASGWGGFLSLGNPLGNTTMLEGVQKVSPGAALRYNASEDELKTHVYWTWPAPDPSITQDNIDTGAIVDFYRKDVKRYLQYSRQSSILLSGGFDSRFILALLAEAQADVNAYIFGHEDECFGADGKYAKRAADLAGIPYQYIQPPRSFYESNEYIDYLLRDEISKPSLYLFIAQIPSCLTPNLKAVWDGAFPGPGLNHPLKFQSTLDALRNPSRSARWKEAVTLFADAFTENLQPAFMGELECELGKYADDDFGTGEFFVRNVTRNRPVTSPLKAYSNEVMAFTPGMSREYWDMIGSVSLNVRSTPHLYQKIYRRHFPHFLKEHFYSKGKLTTNRAINISHSLRVSAEKAFKIYNRARCSRFASVFGNHHKRDAGNPYWDESRLIHTVISRIDPSHPDLNSNAVHRLQRKQGYPGNANVARHVLFYWQTWRWIMEGKFTNGNPMVGKERKIRNNA